MNVCHSGIFVSDSIGFCFWFCCCFSVSFLTTNSCLPNFICVKLGSWGMTSYREIDAFICSCGNLLTRDTLVLSRSLALWRVQGLEFDPRAILSSVVAFYWSVFVSFQNACLFFYFAFGCFFFFQFHNASKVCVSCSPRNLPIILPLLQRKKPGMRFLEKLQVIF